MTNKIIEAARLAGWSDLHIEMASPSERERLARFAALVRNKALEDAAQACRPFGKTGAVVAAAIKALKDQNAAIAAGKGEVNG